MIQFSLPISKKLQRPTLQLTKFHNFYAMIDTGSVFPVWCAPEDALKELGGEKLKDSVTFGGFGGKAEGKLYEIPLFQLGQLIYPHLNIIVHPDTSFVSSFILPATMFNNLIYEINNKTHRLNITVPDDESNVRNLTIKDDNGRLHVFCSSSDENIKELYL